MKRKLLSIGVPVLGAALVAGCSGDNGGNGSTMASYEVTVTNLSEAQPLSPPALVLHQSGYHPWHVGSAATAGLEQLAEGGDATTLLTEAETQGAVVTTKADTAVIVPGGSSSVLIEGEHHADLSLSVATMLVNTNDGFTGLDAEPIGALPVRGAHSLVLTAYDSGTESNSESAATVPGPAAGGEGFNGARDDRDTVGGHPGVISAADGLAGSALGAQHRFDNPVARIRITRLQ